MVIILACALVELLKRRIFWLIPAAILLVGAWGASKLQFVEPKKTAPLSVSLIQGNIPQDLKWLTEYQLKTLMIYAKLTRSEWGRDLIVWPESSIPMFQTDIQPFLDAMNQTSQGQWFCMGDRHTVLGSSCIASGPNTAVLQQYYGLRFRCTRIV